MAIKKIDNIYIDGKNRAWGGYIHSVSYRPSFGEAPSEVTVEMVNESGIYDIDKNDLTLVGSPSLIKLGSKISFYCYPIEYQIEESPSGNTLRVEYIDDSGTLLDKNVVKLKTRGLPSESYPNTIVVGQERARNATLSESLNKQLGTQVNNIMVSDVDYTFPELLSRISIYINTAPSLDNAATNYRKDYSGRLREVLSAWCNDFGLGFYWENKKLNFIDLRNPANLSAVEAYAESIKKLNNIESNSYGYSLRDTFSRGIEVFFGKDGEPAPIESPESQRPPKEYLFNNIRLEDNTRSFDIKGINIDAGSTNFNDRFKSAYYGLSFFIVQSLISKTNDLKGCFDTAKPNDATIDEVAKDTPFYDKRRSYDWLAVKLANKSIDLELVFSRYEAYAKFYGRFYKFRISTQERAKKIFNQEGRFYNEWTPLSQVDIFSPYLTPLSPYIRDYQTLSLRGFIENSGETVGDRPRNYNGTEGYLILDVKPEWRPENAGTSLDLNQYVIVEGDPDKPFFSTGTDKSPIFYVGRDKAGDGLVDLKNINLPSISPVSVSSTEEAGGISLSVSAIPKIEYTLYNSPPSINVNYYDLSSATLSEDQVLGASALYHKNLSLNQSSFSLAARDLVLTTNINQTAPFYSSSISVPNIDLAGGVPVSMGLGLLGISIAIGANGVNTEYKFGTENMKVRNPDVFYRYVYDTAKKKQELIPIPSVTISRGSANRKF